jgi:hypothetical protein
MTSRLSLLTPGGERRRSPRYPVPPGASLVVGVAVTDGGGKPRTFTGRARDVSPNGLAILLPPDESCGELVGHSHSVAVVVSLPAGVIQFRASPAYCHPPSGGQTASGYVVGMRIAEISEQNQSLLEEYLQGLGARGEIEG